MSFDPTPNLLFPSCADCDRIGLHLMPEMLRTMERELGADAVRAFLVAYGGREFVGRASRAGPRLEGTEAEAWMDTHYPGERLTVPKGPTSHSARLAWTIFVRLKEGWSLARIAQDTGVHTRTVSNRKTLFTSLGILHSATDQAKPLQETQRC